MRRSQQGYVGGSSLILIAIVIGLIAAWNMGATPEPLKWLRLKPSPATPSQGEFADRADDSSQALSHVSIRGHVSVQMSVTAAREGLTAPDAYVLVRAGQDVGLDLPRGRYTLKVATFDSQRTEKTDAPVRTTSYDVDLTAAGVVVDLNRQNSGRLPFPFEAR